MENPEPSSGREATGIQLVRYARGGMLDILRESYVSGEGQKMAGARQIIPLLADRAWPVSFETVKTISINNKDYRVAIGVKYLPGNKEKAELRLMNVDLPVFLKIKIGDGNGNSWVIKNILGSRFTELIQAHKIDGPGNKIDGSDKKGVDQVLSINSVPIREIFQFFATEHTNY